MTSPRRVDQISSSENGGQGEGDQGRERVGLLVLRPLGLA